LKKILSTHWLILKSGIEKFIVKNFDIFVPSSAGNFKILGHHTKVGINQIFPILSKLLTSIQIKKKIMSAKMFSTKMKNEKNTEIIKDFFNKYKSDKSKIHNYHLIYGSLFKKKEKVKKVLEIGLGTDNINLISNMGSLGKPGASVRAFRDFFPKAKIYGADIDKEILFKDERIRTYYVDQTDLMSLKSLYKKIGSNFDLIIDDGLHASYANINVIVSSLKFLKKRGFLIIEDIPFKTIPIWEVVINILGEKYESQLIKCKNSLVFIIKKI
tara:strand:+ start:1130 stop:1942 length:813 start_codon:yes stop_codon:yes gene_type:complete